MPEVSEPRKEYETGSDYESGNEYASGAGNGPGVDHEPLGKYVFAPVSLQDRGRYLDCLTQSPETASDYSFANIWGWAEEYGLEWTFSRTHAWLRQTRPETVYWAPVGPWRDVPDWARCPVLNQLAPARFTRVPEDLALTWKKALGDDLELEECRDHFDYVYSVDELSRLAGNKFHKKKNLLNQFNKKYDHQYHAMTMNCVEEALEMQEKWCQWRDCEPGGVLEAENRAIARVLKHWDQIPGLFGGVIEIDGIQAAYTVAERLSADTLVIHFEKAHSNYKGIYQAINQKFLEHEAGDFAFVNREQDLGDPGLRKAKESYNPARYIKKFTAALAQRP